MKKYILQIIVFIIFAKNCFAQIDSIKIENNILDTISIFNFYSNNCIPVISNEKILKKLYGNPLKNEIVFYNHENKKRTKSILLKYSNPKVSYVKLNNKLRLLDLFFNDCNYFIKHKKITLSCNTTLTEIQDKFIFSYQSKYEYPIEFIFPENSPEWNEYKSKKMLRVPFSTGEHENIFIFLYFIDNRLIYIEMDYFNQIIR